MASAALLSSFTTNPKSGVSRHQIISWNNTPQKLLHRDDDELNRNLQNPRAAKIHFLKTKAAKDDRITKPKSVICVDCDGNGAVVCSQCKGNGVNSEDLFNGRFKAGNTCWLCGGKKEMLCGGCNGAGFIGGFMSTFDE